MGGWGDFGFSSDSVTITKFITIAMVHKKSPAFQPGINRGINFRIDSKFCSYFTGISSRVFTKSFQNFGIVLIWQRSFEV